MNRRDFLKSILLSIPAVSLVSMLCKSKQVGKGYKDTITIDEFKNLIPCDRTRHRFGRFGLSYKKHVAQCRNLKLGDSVAFLEVRPDLEYSGPIKNAARIQVKFARVV